MKRRASQIATLATFHNRCLYTIEALESLTSQVFLNDATIQHFLVDDGSSDGTGTVIMSRFPQVTIIPGSGTLYWAGGMRYGWEQQLCKQSFDYLFVYNDDTRFIPDALSHLFELAQAWGGHTRPLAVVGTVVDPQTGKPTYGGRRRSSIWHPLKFAHLIDPCGEVQEADVFNMNAVLLSRGALDRIGFLAPFFVHSGADFEFGLRLREAGGVILVAPGVVGSCSPNPLSDPRQPLPRSIRGRLRYLLDPKREPPRQRWAMYRLHGGPFWLLLFLIPYITIWLPRRRP
jgi:GT2 family glycosyltransferase